MIVSLDHLQCRNCIIRVASLSPFIHYMNYDFIIFFTLLITNVYYHAATAIINYLIFHQIEKFLHQVNNT